MEGISIKTVLLSNVIYKCPLISVYFVCVSMHCIFDNNAEVGKDGNS